MLPRRSLASAFAGVILLAAPAAWADRVALLPSRGGADPGARTTLDGELAKSLAALGHTLVPEAELSAAMRAQVSDGVADTQEEYRAVGAATHASWVLVGTVEPAVSTARVELTACLVKAGRVEVVAREVEQARAQPQVQEMLVVLVRPEGIGAGALPWEQLGATPPPAPPPPAPPPPAPPPAPPEPPPPPAVPPVDGRAHVNYPLGSSGDVWPPYSAGKRGFVSASVGFALPAARPGSAAGSGASFVGALRGGYAVGDLGFEPFAELGGNLSGPAALWLAAGARWMLSPTLKRGADGVLAGVPFFLGPEIVAGTFIQLGSGDEISPTNGAVYSSPAVSRGLLGAALDLSLALSPSFSLESQLGNLRWVPGGSGTIVLVGATVGATLRF
jgi:hypothetical protein